MRCQICGEDADRVYRVDSDGVEKTIAYCFRCLGKVVGNGLKMNPKGLALMTAYANIVQDTPSNLPPRGKINYSEVFVKMPVVVLGVMFEDDGNMEERKRKEMYTRKMALLQRELKSALERENYREASVIKRMIQEIKKLIEK